MVNHPSGNLQDALAAAGERPDGDLRHRVNQVANELPNLEIQSPQHAAEFGADDDGRWNGELSGVEPGLYTLRLDELDASGTVLSRMETPFRREAPAVLSAASEASVSDTDEGSDNRPRITTVTVQKGDTLWALSNSHYGDGMLFVRLHDANRADIRDPDLIYPGQVFTIPE